MWSQKSPNFACKPQILITKDFEKSRFRSQSRDFCQIFEGFGFSFEKSGFGKKSRFRFWKNLVSEKSLGFDFGRFGLGRKVSVSEKFGLGKMSRFRFRKIWYRKKSLGIGFSQNFGIVIQCCEPEDANKKRDKSNSTEEEDDIKEDAFSGLTTSVWVGTGAKVSPQQVLNFKILKQVC